MQVDTAVAYPIDSSLDSEGVKQVRKTLPSSWWSSQKVLELEKRAIFSKSWIYSSHTSRFQSPGAYYEFCDIGSNYFLVRSKSEVITGFRYLCLHDLKFDGETGCLSCSENCWSYNIDDSTETEGLFKIHIHTTDQGFIFVNFDILSDAPMEFNQWFQGLEEEMHEYDFHNYEYSESFQLDGEFNWKTFLDGYQECYHCPTAHPGLNGSFNMETYKVIPKGRYARHYCDNKGSAVKQASQPESSWLGIGKANKGTSITKKQNAAGNNDGLWMYLYPNVGISCYQPAWLSLRVLPITSTRTIIQYDIYMRKGISVEKKEEFVKFLRIVQDEDFNLCIETQKNLNQGVYTTGILHPQKESGVVYYQGIIRDMIKEHWSLEKESGAIVNPLSRN